MFGLINLPSVSSWALLGVRLRHFLDQPRKLRIFNVIAAVILVMTLATADSLTNIRITTFFAGEHEVRVLDPSRVELLAAIGCEVKSEG